jgi:hypothetical protein
MRKSSSTSAAKDAVVSFEKILMELCLNESLCHSQDEAIAIVDSIRNDYSSASASDDEVYCDNTTFMIPSLQEYLGISENASHSLVAKCLLWIEAKTEERMDNGEDSSSASCSNNSSSSSSCEDEEVLNDEEDEYIGKGACELCERQDIKLTRHHMIPKSTYSRIKSKLIRAVIDTATDNDKKQKSNNIDHFVENKGLDHLIPYVIEIANDNNINTSNKQRQ